MAIPKTGTYDPPNYNGEPSDTPSKKSRILEKLSEKLRENAYTYAPLSVRHQVWLGAWKAAYEKKGNTLAAALAANECLEAFDMKFKP